VILDLSMFLIIDLLGAVFVDGLRRKKYLETSYNWKFGGTRVS
jgi:hypothetical protein